MRNVLAILALTVTLLISASLPVRAAALAFGEAETRTAGHSFGARASDDYLRRVDQALALIESSGGIEAEPTLATILAASEFKRLPKSKRYGFLIAAGGNATRAGKAQLGRNRLARAVAIDPDQPNGWYLLSMAEAQLGNGAAAAERLTHLAITWPELVDYIEARPLWYVAFVAERRSQAHLNLLQAFFDAGWNRSPASASNFWFQLALLRLERGEVDAARTVAARVNHPTDVVAMRMDKRFAPLTSGQENAWDPVDKGTQLLVILRERSTAAPTDLEVQTELLETLLVMGLHTEALEISTPILQAMDEGDPAYQSAHMHNWIANHRALALLRLGRVDEGLTQMIIASELSEDQQTGNTSQVLNLAQLYGRLNRPEEALATVGRVAQMSDYGRMVEASVRHTASVRRGDADASAKALEFLRENRSKAPDHYLHALLTADMEDAATVAIIELLRSEDDRSGTLRWLQDLKQPPTLKGEVNLRERWLRLRKRAEVQAEVEQWGSMGTYPIYGG